MTARLALRPFWYLRHGETDWNARNLSQGRADIPLNEAGLRQSARAAEIIAAHRHDFTAFTHIVSSPLGRAYRTAELVAEKLAEREGVVLPITADIDLQEVAFGEQEGLPMGDWYDDWIAGDYTPQGAEPFQQLVSRAVAAIDRATAHAGVPLVVAHGALFRALRMAMDLPANVRLPNASPLWIRPGSPDPLPWILTDLGA